MERINKEFVDRSMRELSKYGQILDIGGGEPFGKWLRTYKDVFSSCVFKTFDYDASTGADIVGDIHAIPLPDSSVSAIICSSVLEHVRDPLKAMAELTRILKPGGSIFVYVPSIYPYHARPGHYPDYWRFFDDTLREMFKEYEHVQIEKRGGYFLALSFFVPQQHRLRWILNPFARILDKIFSTQKRNTTAGYYVYATRS